MVPSKIPVCLSLISQGNDVRLSVKYDTKKRLGIIHFVGLDRISIWIKWCGCVPVQEVLFNSLVFQVPLTLAGTNYGSV